MLKQAQATPMNGRGPDESPSSRRTARDPSSPPAKRRSTCSQEAASILRPLPRRIAAHSRLTPLSFGALVLVLG